jgi:hypothetical protein
LPLALDLSRGAVALLRVLELGGCTSGSSDAMLVGLWVSLAGFGCSAFWVFPPKLKKLMESLEAFWKLRSFLIDDLPCEGGERRVSVGLPDRLVKEPEKTCTERASTEAVSETQAGVLNTVSKSGRPFRESIANR